MQDELWINWEVQLSKNQNKEGSKAFAKPKTKVNSEDVPHRITCSPARFSITALPKGKTANAEYFVQFLKDSNKRFTNLKQKKTRLKDLTLQFDNAKPHTAQKIKDCISSQGVITNYYQTKSLQCRFKPVRQVPIHKTAGTLRNQAL